MEVTFLAKFLSCKFCKNSKKFGKKLRNIVLPPNFLCLGCYLTKKACKPRKKSDCISLNNSQGRKKRGQLFEGDDYFKYCSLQVMP